MAEQAPEETKPYVFTPEGQPDTNSSKDYTGKGKAQYCNGDIYVGQFVNGKRNGQGVYDFAQKGENPPDKYEGEFKDNLKHGVGKLTYGTKQEVYYGQFENGKRHGQGLYTYNNKDVYSGSWQFGKKHGQGTYVFAKTQMRLKGNWHENKLVSGEWIYPNNTVYKGKFEFNKPNGEGVWSFPNGNTIKGAYKQTKVVSDDPKDKSINIKLSWAADPNQ